MSLDIIQADLGGLISEIEGKTLTVYLNNPRNIQSANLPMRLLGLLDGATKQESERLTLDGMRRDTYVLQELLLWKPATMGEGPAEAAAAIQAYMQLYVKTVTLTPKLPGGGWVTNISAEPGVFTYPKEGSTAYIGCLATVTIQEIVKP